MLLRSPVANLDVDQSVRKLYSEDPNVSGPLLIVWFRTCSVLLYLQFAKQKEDILFREEMPQPELKVFISISGKVNTFFGQRPP